MSWQMDYLRNNWAYKILSTQATPGYAGILKTMGTTTKALNNEVIEGLVHQATVALIGSQDCRNATVQFVDSGQGGSIAIGSFTFAQINNSGNLGWAGFNIYTPEFSDAEKVYIATFSPPYPIPIHRLDIILTLPTPTLDPAATTCLEQHVIIASQPLGIPLNYGRNLLNQNGTMTNISGKSPGGLGGF